MDGFDIGPHIRVKIQILISVSPFCFSNLNPMSNSRRVETVKHT
jgi:hypothetical protein